MIYIKKPQRPKIRKVSFTKFNSSGSRVAYRGEPDALPTASTAFMQQGSLLLKPRGWSAFLPWTGGN